MKPNALLPLSGSTATNKKNLGKHTISPFSILSGLLQLQKLTTDQERMHRVAERHEPLLACCGKLHQAGRWIDVDNRCG